MARLPRPYIPFSIRVKVAERQLVEFGIWNDFHVSVMRNSPTPSGQRLAYALGLLFNGRKCELHHRPSLVNRRRKRNGEYDPPANDPYYLVYLLEDEHDVETRVRGQRGQHSDLALARKRKRIEKKKKQPKRKWASRPFPKGRKFQQRRK